MGEEYYYAKDYTKALKWVLFAVYFRKYWSPYTEIGIDTYIAGFVINVSIFINSSYVISSQVSSAT